MPGGALKNFGNFTEKYLCQSLFFLNKVEFGTLLNALLLVSMLCVLQKFL